MTSSDAQLAPMATQLLRSYRQVGHSRTLIVLQSGNRACTATGP